MSRRSPAAWLVVFAATLFFVTSASAQKPGAFSDAGSCFIDAEGSPPLADEGRSLRQVNSPVEMPEFDPCPSLDGPLTDAGPAPDECPIPSAQCIMPGPIEPVQTVTEALKEFRGEDPAHDVPDASPTSPPQDAGPDDAASAPALPNPVAPRPPSTPTLPNLDVAPEETPSKASVPDAGSAAANDPPAAPPQPAAEAAVASAVVPWDGVPGRLQAATTTICILAFTWYLAAAGRDFIGAVLGRHSAAPLGHAIRVKLVKEVTDHPGMNRSQLAARVAIGPWLARYHLRVLRRAGFLDVVRAGNSDTYLPNHASYRFFLAARSSPRAGSAAGTDRIFVAAALATLNHPTRRRICEIVRREGPVHYARLVQRWNTDGATARVPSPRDLTYHATLMARSGLLSRRRDGRHVLWELNIDLDEAFQRSRRHAEFATPSVPDSLRVGRVG